MRTRHGPLSLSSAVPGTKVAGWDKAALAAAGPPGVGGIGGPAFAHASWSHPTQEDQHFARTKDGVHVRFQYAAALRILAAILRQALRQEPAEDGPGNAPWASAPLRDVGNPFTAVDHLLPTISGTVFHDLNGNGVDNGEPGVAGVTVTLFEDNGSGQFSTSDQVFDTTQTNASGNYQFTDVPVGTYWVQQSAAPGLALARARARGKSKSPPKRRKAPSAP